MIPVFPFFKQMGEFDCGIACLRMIATYYGGNISRKCLRKLIQFQTKGVSLLQLSYAAEKIGLRNLGVKITYDRLADDIPTPCIAFWKQQHFVVIYHADEQNVFVADPAAKGLYVYSKEAFNDGWICDPKNEEGILLLLEPTSLFLEKKKKRLLELNLSVT